MTNIFKAPECKVSRASYEDFKAICSEGEESSAGLDGWAAKGISLMSDLAIELVVDLLNAIEEGAPWPQRMLITRAVFLSKYPEGTANPLAYRILKITSGWYRKWASVRNRRNLHNWIKSWDTHELNW